MEALSPLEKKLLLELQRHDGSAAPEEIDMELVKTMNAASWLQSKRLVNMEERLVKEYELTDEGRRFLEEGLPEKKLLSMDGAGVDEVEEKFGKKDAGIMIGWAVRKGWCKIINKDGRKFIEITEEGRKAMEREQPEELALKEIAAGNHEIESSTAEILKKRRAIKERERIHRKIVLTERGWEIVNKGIEIEEELSQLTPQIIRSGEWKKKKFRRYDVRAFAPSIYAAKRHPLSQLIEKIRRIFAEMGFSEISGGYVESAFWNMDALFIPQDHPARDMQDTFYCKKPDKIEIDEELLNKVAEVHEHGIDGSRGWQYSFDKDESKKALLRTHTTVNTIRYLYQNPVPPAKVFSIERVFRRENIDSTHLPEFHQIEGIVYEEDANFGMLKGILREFYTRMGFEKIRFRPAYFPYTEPSMEIEVLFMGRWIELGGSGIFRPEVTKTFGIEYPVLAWGLGLERMAMILLGLKDIRTLYFSDIKWLHELPLL
ncbi:MAG: phenylalanine--tRNA ligase subunit alpha [Thermoplasmata archaeon]|nr:phenylalanine--tRNA ligase subunit alpha [Thermoplasmata archaeon]